MKALISSAIALTAFRYGFKSSWTVALLAAGATFAVMGSGAIKWKNNQPAVDVGIPPTLPTTPPATDGPSGIISAPGITQTADPVLQ